MTKLAFELLSIGGLVKQAKILKTPLSATEETLTVITEARWLLVYGNADDPPLLGEHWPHYATGRVLVTSRNSMHDTSVMTERYEIEAMTGPEASSMLLSMLRVTDHDEASSRTALEI